MILEQLRVQDFRNLREVQIEPSPTLNMLHGANGQGKTSLLEAIHFVAEGRSFRSATATDLVRRGSEQLLVEADVRSRLGTVDALGASYSPSEKHLRLNGRETPSLESFLGHLRVVVHSPEDAHLVVGPPEARRRFLNRILVLTRPGFFRVLARYVRALRNRNRCLMDHRTPSEIASWTEVLIQNGSRILAERLRLISLLGPRLMAAVRRITAGGLPISLRYRCGDPVLEAPIAEADAETLLRSQAERHAAHELRRERTLFGPHLDELEIGIEAGPARRRASQGERRSVLIALRLAERAVIADETGEDPVFLLDDLSSELDAERARRVVEAVAEVPGQVFLTGTERRSGPRDARTFHTVAGELFADATSGAAVEALATLDRASPAVPAGRVIS